MNTAGWKQPAVLFGMLTRALTDAVKRAALHRVRVER
jgi:hypothetical protein